MSDQHQDPLVNEGVDFEESDVNTGWLTGSAIAIFILTIAAMLLTVVFINGLETRQAELAPTPLPLVENRPTPPAPRLQPNVLDRQTAEEDMVDMYDEIDQTLNNYGWVDEEGGVARVPIEKAIELLTTGEDTGEEVPQ